MQNGICEAFNSKMRDELLNETLFHGLDHARAVVADWVADYNAERPHSALGYQTAAAFAAQLTAMGDRLHGTEAFRRSPIASMGKQSQSQPSTSSSGTSGETALRRAISSSVKRCINGLQLTSTSARGVQSASSRAPRRYPSCLTHLDDANAA